VEFRPVSTQPTPEENVAIMAFYTGRLLWSQQTNEEFLPLELIQENKLEAEKNGTKAMLWTRDNQGSISKLSASISLELEIERAFRGLRAAGVGNNNWLDVASEILKQNLREGSPAEKLDRFVQNHEGEKQEVIVQGLKNLRAFK